MILCRIGSMLRMWSPLDSQDSCKSQILIIVGWDLGVEKFFKCVCVLVWDSEIDIYFFSFQPFVFLLVFIENGPG